MYKNLDLVTLEREYSPSSCIDDIGIFIQAYIEQSKSAHDLATNKGKVVSNINYGPHKDMTLDLFEPFDSNTSKDKLQVYIHGGYWQELSKNESSFAATNFQKHGYHFAVVNYSLAPNATLTEIVEQNRQALVWLFKNAEQYGYDKNEIYLSGSSAGGHLAMMMAITDWAQYLPLQHNIVRGICAVSGIYDLTPIAQTYINDQLQLTDNEILTNSPLLTLVDGEILASCNIILAFGDNETSEFKHQTNDMVRLLTELVQLPLLNEIEDRNHFDVILDLAKPESWLSQQVMAQMN